MLGVPCHYMDKQDLSRAGDLRFHRYSPNHRVAGRRDIGLNTSGLRAFLLQPTQRKGNGMKRIVSIAALLAAAIPLWLLKSVPAHAEGMEISPDASRPPTAGSPEFFTGDVVIKPLFDATEYSDTSGGQVAFTPGARSAWHTHPAGQTLIVTSGTGWVQQSGGAKQQINPGDVIWTPPGVKHGTAPPPPQR